MAFNEHLIGKREQIAWVAETSYGSGGTMSSGEIIGLNTRLEPAFDQNWQEILNSGSGDRYVDSRELGPKTLPFTLIFTPVNWKFLKYCGYGVVDSAGPTPYTHTFTLANVIQSFKLEWAKQHTTNHVITLTGCTVKSCTISFAKSTGAGEGNIMVSLACVGKAESQGSTVTSLSEIIASPMQWRHTKLTLDTTEVVELNNGEINIDNGIDENDSRYCNATLDRDLGEPIPKVHRITGRFNVNLKDKTYYDFWHAATAVGGTNKLEFIRGANDDVVGTFGNFRVASPGCAPTDFDAVSNIDMVWTADSWTSLIATDSESTY